MKNRALKAGRVLVLTVSAATVLFFAGHELALAVPLSASWYLVGLVLVWTSAGVAALSAGRAPRWRFPAWSALVASLLLAILCLVPWTSRKQFLRHLDRVEPGMTREKARQVMLPYRPVGADGPSTADTSDSYRHSQHPRYNADIGLVSYRDGRVSEVVFLPD